MGDNSYTSEIVRNGKTLILFVANLRDARPTRRVEHMVEEAFDRVSKHLKEDKQVLYIRDNSDESLKAAVCWSVCITSPREATIAMPRWGNDQVQIENLALAINEACFSLVRAQQLGLCNIFGDEVLRRGFAASYAEAATGYKYPLFYEVTKYIRNRMLSRWYYFYAGSNKSWSPKRGDFYSATLAGYELAKTLCSEDDPVEFCLNEGAKIHSLLWADDIIWTLSHPKRRRSARILEGRARRPLTLRARLSALQPAFW